MKHLCFLLFCLFLSVNVNGQNKRKKNSEFKVFISSEFQVNVQELFVKKDFYWNATYSDRLKWNNGRIISYGLGVGFALSNNFDLSVGLRKAKMKITQTDGFNFVRCNPEFYGAKRIINANRNLEISTFELPLEIRYRIEFNKFDLLPSLSLGIISYGRKYQYVDIKLDNGILTNHHNNDREIEHNRNLNSFSMFKLAIGYNIIKRIRLNFEPQFRLNFGFDDILTEFNNTKLGGLGIGVRLECGIY